MNKEEKSASDKAAAIDSPNVFEKWAECRLSITDRQLLHRIVAKRRIMCRLHGIPAREVAGNRLCWELSKARHTTIEEIEAMVAKFPAGERVLEGSARLLAHHAISLVRGQIGRDLKTKSQTAIEERLRPTHLKFDGGLSNDEMEIRNNLYWALHILVYRLRLERSAVKETVAEGEFDHTIISLANLHPVNSAEKGDRLTDLANRCGVDLLQFIQKLLYDTATSHYRTGVCSSSRFDLCTACSVEQQSIHES